MEYIFVRFSDALALSFSADHNPRAHHESNARCFNPAAPCLVSERWPLKRWFRKLAGWANGNR
jgi:hypothetical protein